MRVSALIPAAGSGTRLGMGPKAFVQLRGVPLVELAVRSFAGRADELIVALPPAEIDEARAFGWEARIIPGGATRQESVAALTAAATGELLVVHDAARPFLTPQVLSRVLTAAKRVGASSAALTPADTLISAGDGGVIDRELVRLVQTPQAFRRELLLRAHERARRDGFEATDDATLVRRLGQRVELVEGSPLLTKLTSSAELGLLEGLYGAWLKELGISAP